MDYPRVVNPQIVPFWSCHLAVETGRWLVQSPLRIAGKTCCGGALHWTHEACAIAARKAEIPDATRSTVLQMVEPGREAPPAAATLPSQTTNEKIAHSLHAPSQRAHLHLA